MKKLFYNLKSAKLKIFWCIAALFMVLSFAMKVDCNDDLKKSVITLPKAESGIEKLEYMVNGEAKGSTDGIHSIELEPGTKITFAVKFESEGYNKLHVRNLKIKSENGSALKFNTYSKDSEGNFVLMRVEDSELINPEQTYISSDYIVGKDDKLSFEGIEEDKYCVKIADENNDVNLSDAVELKYSENGDNYIDAEFSEAENAFIINGLTKSSNVKLTFKIKEGYSNSNLSLVNNEKQIAIDEKSKTCTLPELKNNINLEIRNLEKNSYDVTFKEYTNAKFSCKIAGSEDEFKSVESTKVHYGESLEIKCDTSSNDILESGKITANGKVLAAKDGIYTLENIKNHYSVAVTPNENAVYTISLPENESRFKLCDTLGNEVSEINAKQNDSVNFKLIPSDAYQKNFILSEMYAIPMSKLSGGTYDLNANPEEAKSFLMIPMGNYVYTLKNINEPVKIIADKMEKNSYNVTLPEKIIGARAEVELNENVTKITENKFKVVHGSDLTVNLEAHPGYDLSTMNVADVNNSLEVKKDGNKYTFKNIDSDKYLIINGAKTASCKVSLDANDVIATNENGSAWKNNITSVKYSEGTLVFKVRPADTSNDTGEEISLSIGSGSGKLEKVASEKNTYSLSNVTSDIILSSEKSQSSNVTITLKSDNDDIEFTDANDESIILPEENTVKYGTDLKFKVLSKSGKSTDNTSVISTVSNPITESDTSSNTYSMTALRSGATITNTREAGNSDNNSSETTPGESDNSDPQGDAVQHSVTFVPIGGIFRDQNDTPTNAASVNDKSSLIFYTEPQTGYQYTDTLKITGESDYTVNNISNIKIIQPSNDSTESDTRKDYNGEWIGLNETESQPADTFIRAIRDGSRIKYEIAGNTDKINKYIVFSRAEEDETGKIISYEYEEKTAGGEGITPKGVTTDLKITSTREKTKASITFSYAEGIEYTDLGNNPLPTEPTKLNYGEAFAFKVAAKSGYDISNIQVTASTAGNTNILPLTNGMYVIINITEDTTVSVSGIEKSNISLTFEQYDGVKYKNTSGAEYPVKQQIPYNEEIIFQLDIDEAHSGSASGITVKVNNDTFNSGDDHTKPYKVDNLYVIPGSYATKDMKITISGLEVNKYSVTLKPTNGISYRKVTEPDKTLPETNTDINYGNSFKFRLQANDGYDISKIEVVAKGNSGSGTPVTIIPANGIYTIENITSDYTVTVSGVSKQQHTVEFRTVTGVACTDSYGKTLPSSVTVSDGDNYSFYLSFDPAYNKSKDTADVTIKGTNNKVPRDSSGKYTISNITENKIVEVINVKKNSYTATFVPAEGVIYRTAKGKEFSGTQQVEYGETLYFKISLLDAYDQSFPAVKMNGTKTLVENSGSYVLENISDDVTVTVENVVKNPEEVTIDRIQNVPNPVTNEDDVNAVVAATKAYNSLSDEEKKLVTNKHELEKAQSEAGDINHTSNGVTISGVDWNVKLIVTPLSDNEEEMRAFSEEVDRRSVLSLYRAELIDLLTGESYSIPYGNQVQITLPCPDLTGYKNVTVAHRNLADNMEYLDPNIVDGTVKFSATSVGLFGIAAKEIPNYSENTSNMSISMGNLVSGDDELKTLLGEDLSSQLGHLIDLEDENDNNGGSSDKSGGKGTNNNGGDENSDSLLNSMANGILSLANSAYNWALDNELLAVLAILLLGSLLILIIFLMNRKKDKEDDNLEKKNP